MLYTWWRFQISNPQHFAPKTGKVVVVLIFWFVFYLVMLLYIDPWVKIKLKTPWNLQSLLPSINSQLNISPKSFLMTTTWSLCPQLSNDTSIFCLRQRKQTFMTKYKNSKNVILAAIGRKVFRIEELESPLIVEWVCFLNRDSRSSSLWVTRL